jgi:hypothetical protein
VTVSHGTPIPHSELGGAEELGQMRLHANATNRVGAQRQRILKVEWAVRPLGRRVAAIPDDAVAMATPYRPSSPTVERAVASKFLYRYVLSCLCRPARQ